MNLLVITVLGTFGLILLACGLLGQRYTENLKSIRIERQP